VDSAEAQQDLANAYFHLGAAEEAGQKFQDAIRDLRVAESMLRARQTPGDPLDSGRLYINIQRELAQALLDVHDWTGATSAVERGLAIAQSRTDAAEKSGLGRKLDQIREAQRNWIARRQ
jgi:tetratricopeptide (TPR) repeat protein